MSVIQEHKDMQREMVKLLQCACTRGKLFSDCCRRVTVVPQDGRLLKPALQNEAPNHKASAHSPFMLFWYHQLSRWKSAKRNVLTLRRCVDIDPKTYIHYHVAKYSGKLTISLVHCVEPCPFPLLPRWHSGCRLPCLSVSPSWLAEDCGEACLLRQCPAQPSPAILHLVFNRWPAVIKTLNLTQWSGQTIDWIPLPFTANCNGGRYGQHDQYENITAYLKALSSLIASPK